MIGSRASDHLRELARIAEFKGRRPIASKTRRSCNRAGFPGEEVGIVVGATGLDPVVREVKDPAGAILRGSVKGGCWRDWLNETACEDLVGLLVRLCPPVVAGAVALRESLGAQARFDYQSPRNSDYRVEIYEDAGFGGDPSFALFVLDSGVRKYLGRIDADPHSVGTSKTFIGRMMGR